MKSQLFLFLLGSFFLAGCSSSPVIRDPASESRADCVPFESTKLCVNDKVIWREPNSLGLLVRAGSGKIAGFRNDDGHVKADIFRLTAPDQYETTASACATIDMIAMRVPILGSFQEGQLVLVASITSTVDAEMYQVQSLFSDGTADLGDKRIEFSEKSGFTGELRRIMWSFPPSWTTSILFVPTDVIDLENGLSARVGDPVSKKQGFLSKKHGTIEALFIRGDQKDAVVQIEFDDRSKALFSRQQIIPGKKGHQIGK